MSDEIEVTDGGIKRLEELGETTWAGRVWQRMGETMPPTHLLYAAHDAALGHGLDPRLICALCEVESSWMPWAVRHESGYEWLFGRIEDDFPGIIKFKHSYPGSLSTEVQMQKTSWGLMQIMGAVARERGFRGWLTELCDPAVNLQWGCRHIRWMIDHNNAYGLPDFRIKPEDLAAAWNAGKARFVDGKYTNQSYVDRVVKAMEGVSE